MNDLWLYVRLAWLRGVRPVFVAWHIWLLIHGGAPSLT